MCETILHMVVHTSHHRAKQNANGRSRMQTNNNARPLRKQRCQIANCHKLKLLGNGLNNVYQAVQ